MPGKVWEFAEALGEWRIFYARILLSILRSVGFIGNMLYGGGCLYSLSESGYCLILFY